MLNKVEDAIQDIRNGKMVVVVDDEDRENEGDLVLAAEFATPEKVNFILKHARGLVCVALKEKRIIELNLPPMVSRNQMSLNTAFTVSVEVKEGITTGISAQDRSRTIQALANPNLLSDDFVKPGHIFPLQAKKGGVLVRAGHTEASIDLCEAAEVFSAGVICEILNDDGTMARLPELKTFAKEFDLKIISIADLISYRRNNQILIEKMAAPKMPTRYGLFQAVTFRETMTGQEHLALMNGEIDPSKPVLTRIHSECLTGDALGSSRCDCGQQLDLAMKMIAKEGGILVYMRQEGRGIGLLKKMQAYELQDQGMDTVEANIHLGFSPDMRNYGIGAQILSSLGVRKMHLITNNPEKRIGLSSHGLDIVKRVPLEIQSNVHNQHYLKIKKEKMGHDLRGI